MIFVGKKGNVPASLDNETTINRRNELIAADGWIDENVYSSRYKQDDVKTALNAHYHYKCCYCEQRVEAGQVEHYRPKNRYWWLAYSWDNLMRVCPQCNLHKSNNFEISGNRASYQPQDLPQIHSLCGAYNQMESPSLLNPECDDLEDMWKFDERGNIFSPYYRGKYTIDNLCLNRVPLVDSRIEIYRELEDEVLGIYTIYGNNKNVLLNQLYPVIEKFSHNTENPKKEFRAFRRYAIHFINELLIEIFT